MWIVRLALQRPYTFVVMALLIVALGGIATGLYGMVKASADAQRAFTQFGIRTNMTDAQVRRAMESIRGQSEKLNTEVADLTKGVETWARITGKSADDVDKSFGEIAKAAKAAMMREYKRRRAALS